MNFTTDSNQRKNVHLFRLKLGIEIGASILSEKIKNEENFYVYMRMLLLNSLWLIT